MKSLLLPNVALVALVVIFIVRARTAFRIPAARLSWLASGVGALALIARGSVIPQTVIDPLLGGSNLINLVQNILATTAFWLVLQAVAPRRNGDTVSLRWTPLVLMIIAFSVPFFFIADRTPTSTSFVVDYVDQIPLAIYISIYMACIAGICVVLAMRTYRRTGLIYKLFVVGTASVVLGSLSEITYVVTESFNVGPETLRQLAFDLFDPFFYLGVVLIAGVIAVLAAGRGIRDRRVGRSIAALEGILQSRDIDSQGSTPHTLDRAPRIRAISRLYDLTIAIRDREQSGDLTLTRGEKATLRAGEALVAAHLMARPRGRGPQPSDVILRDGH